MKTARKVVFPDRILTYEEYKDLSSHALNSSIWYATNFVRNSSQIIDKLIKKGYPNDMVEYKDKDNMVHSTNIIEDTVQQLKEIHLIDDEEYVRSVLSNDLRVGKSLKSIRMKLLRSGLPKDLIEKIFEENALDNKDEEKEGLDRAALKITRLSSFIKGDDWAKRRKLVQGLLMRGFEMDDISKWIDKNTDLCR